MTRFSALAIPKFTLEREIIIGSIHRRKQNINRLKEILGNIFYQSFILCLSASYSQSINDNLLLHYSFNGDAIDQSGNGYDGAPVRITYISDRFGNPNGAASFDGFNDYVDLPNLAVLKPQLPVSFSFWIKYNSSLFTDRAVFNTSFQEELNSGVYFTSRSNQSTYAVGFGNGSPFFNSSAIES